MVPPLERAAAEFSNYLEAQKASFLTRKNYLADINQFLRFIEKQSKKDLQEITSKDIKRYLIIELASSPETTKDRKISSLKKFFSWAKEEKKTNINPVEDYLKDTAYLKPIEKSLSEITEPSINRKVFGNYPSYEGLKARINAYLAGKPRLQKLVYHILYTRPKWYKAYHSLAISRYLNFAILVIFATGLGFGVYQQLFAKPQTPIAYPSQPVPPKRYLSFQGRLTNQYQTPITTPTNIVFKLYDASTGGNTLWNSAGVACSVDPDEDGIFSILLGTTSGDGYTCTGISPIDSSVFTENAEVWLGIKVGSDPEATPRIQIATVAYALNAETLQGYPIDATGSATKNTVLTMNSGGEVVLAEVGPKIKSVSGNFSVQGEAVTIQANGGGVAGDITLSPASDGTVSILASGTTNDSLYIQNAQITSGALIHGYYGGTSTTVDLLKLGAGATESTKFLVESSGDTFIASGADLFIGGIGLNDNSSNSSGASLIGLYDDNMTYISGNTNVQSAIKQLDTAIGTLTGSAGGWTDDGTIVRLTTSSDRVGIGTTSVNSNTKVGILGNLAIGSQTYSDAQAPTNGLIVEGNVGIGTTAPTAKLDVAGDILVNNGGSIDTRAAGTLTIGGTTQTGLTVGRSGATTTINGSSVVINSLSGIIQGSSGTISAITGTANYVPRWSSSAPYLTSTSTIFDNGTNVGIGTTVPTKGKLNVLGSVAIRSTAYTETSGAAPANGLIVEGRVGIATTNPQGILHLITTGSDIPIMATTQTVSATPSSILSFKVNTSANIGRIGAVSVNSIDTFLLSGTSAKQIGLSSNSSSTPDLLITTDGNVGIGATAPTAKLDVAGNILVQGGGSIDTRAAGTLTIGGTTQTGLTVGRSGATTTINGSSVVINSLSGIIQGSSGTISAITGTANYVPRWSSSAPYLTSTSTIFDNGTNVGIGTTVPTKGKLNVLGAVAIGSTAYTETSGAAPTNGLIVEGNVGIGTTNPDRQLKIVTSGDTAPGFSVDGSSLTYNEIFELLGTLPTNPSTGRALTVGIATEAYSRGVFYNDGTLGIGPGSSTRDVFLRRSTTNTMMIDSNMSGGAANFVVTGNVGIGTASPSTFKLEVASSVGPSADNTYDLGSSGRRWANIYGTNIYGNITPTGFTQGSVIFAGAGGTLSQNNANFFWDNTNLRLGIGTNTPSVSIDSTGSLRLTAGTFQIGNAANVAYNRIGTNATNRGLSAASDLLINGKLEVDQAFFPDSGIYGSGGSLVVNFPNNDAWFSDEIWVDGKIGIGTTAPANKLSVIGGVNIGSTSYNVTAPTNGMIVEGNVGIGTTSPVSKFHTQWSSSGCGAQCFSDAAIFENNGNVFIQLMGSTSGEKSLNFANPSNGADGAIKYNYPSVPNGFSFWTNGNVFRMAIDQNGNVGIGTTSPSHKLEVTQSASTSIRSGYFSMTSGTSGTEYIVGQFNVGGSGAQSPAIAISSNGTVGLKLTHSSNFTIGTIDHNYSSATALAFAVRGSEKMRVDNSGNVGIGTTSPRNGLELAKLDSNYITSLRVGGITGGNLSVPLQSETSRHQILFSSWRDVVTNTVGAKIVAINKNVHQQNNALVQNTDLAFFTLGTIPTGTDNTSEVMRITSTGNVGIGTTSPSHKLEVTQSASTSIRSGYFSMTSGTSGTEYIVGQFNVGGSGAQSPAIAISSNGTVGLKLTHSSNFTIGTIDHNYSSATALAFAVRGSEKMRVDNSGNVGIGTTAPASKFHLMWSDAGATGQRFSDAAIFENNGNAFLQLIGSAAGEKSINFAKPTNGADGAIKYNYSSVPNGFSFWTNGNNFRMAIDQNGNVGIGTAWPGNLLDITKNFGSNYIMRIRNYYNGSNRRQLVIYQGGTSTPATTDVYIAFSNDVNWGFNGSITGNGSGGVQYNTTSDKRLKTNLKYVNDALDIINKITPYYFDFIFAPGKTNIGFMAQDIMDIYPYAVSGDPNSDPLINPMQVDYSKFTPLLLAGIKEQQLQIASQSAQIALLEKDLNLTSTGDLNIAQTQDEDYQVQNSQTGDIITRLSAFAETVMGKIRAGSISAYEITTNGFIAFQAQVDNLLVKTGLVSPSVQTAMISPLADEKDIVIRLGKSATGSDSVQGKLSIQNQNGEEVASINSEGDATFSGTLNSENLAVENNATISGDLTANNINTGEIRAEKLVVDQIVSPSGYNSGITLEQIEELLRQAQADQNLLGQAEDWYNATSSAQIKNLAAETATLKNLFVTQSIAANSLSLSQSISLGTDMVIQSQLIDNKLANSIDTLTAPLSIQSLALAPVEIMAGKIRIETNGDVYIAGNLYVAGRVESTGLTVKTSADMTRTDLVRVEDEAGNLAAGISASGSAQFKELASDKIVIAGASVATDSATLQNGEINTNASAGSGILPAGQKEIAIVSPNIKSESLVYVTPTSDTKNYVLYVKAKEDGRMVVGFNRALDIDVYFNWWVIEAR
ncbi:MAG: hypothetical protein CH104c_0839 [Candidatus Woesebacteria bacterium]|nr:MAG: hypothetical protein CH104c_0839 [Candidatus Woesebacteria bacterium]